MTVYVEYQNRSYTIINKGDPNHLKVIQKLSEQHTGKTRNKRNTENSHIGTADLIRKVLKQKNKMFVH
jgi:hypothetical protein